MGTGIEQVGPYRIVGRLGAGGMGEVFLARDTRLERDVAIKMLPPEMSDDADRLGRFRREALALASLNHPNIASIYGFETLDDGTLALVLERVEGETLAERLGRGALPIEETLQVCAQIAEALEVAHERGVVHRDLKPGNVMLGPRGLVKVLDFGLAKSARDPVGPEERRPQGVERPVGRDSAGLAPGEALARDTLGSPLTGAGEAMGTPGYMSPEQALGTPQDARTDVFAFGCVLYECLSGARAFDGTSAFEITAAVLYQDPDLARLPRRTPAGVREVLLRCLEKDPERRLAEIRAARVVLEEALGIRRASALRTGEAVAVVSDLPKPLTSFVGREQELETCAALFAETRLLTLSGVGGCGKTRLALRLAEDRLADHPEGAWFVDLAPLSEAERVPEAVATAIGAREEPGKPLAQTVVETIGERRVLLLLDNCEHLIAASAELAARLLAGCPALRILATSREGLGLAGERLYAVPTMALPPSGAQHDAAAIAAFESVRLFTERAALVQPEFAITAANAPIVAEICRRLDGIPLAIELAAARVKMLSVEQIRGKLDDRFRLLTGGGRGALARHQTLRATIQWSADQLLPEERSLLERLSVFAGGWTLDAATAVCEEQGDAFEVLDRLTRLHDKSLVVVERPASGEVRYRFLESVRQFALEALGTSGEAMSVRERHLDQFLVLAEESEKHLSGPAQGEWSARIALEQENLLAALAFAAQAHEGAERGLRLASAVWRYWSLRGPVELGLRAMGDALRLEGAGRTSPARIRALVRAGGLALLRGDFASARPWIEESLELSRELGDRKGVARSLSGLGVVATYQGDHDRARGCTEEALSIYRELGETRGAAVALHNLGYLAWCAQEIERALDYYEQALKLFAEVGDRGHMAFTLAGVAFASTRLGRHAEARVQFAASLGIVRELDARREGAYALEGVAALAHAEGRPRRAARLLGAAEAVRVGIGSPLEPGEQREQDALLARLLEELGDEALGSARSDGRLLRFEAALDEALRGLDLEAPSAS